MSLFLSGATVSIISNSSLLLFLMLISLYSKLILSHCTSPAEGSSQWGRSWNALSLWSITRSVSKLGYCSLPQRPRKPIFSICFLLRVMRSCASKRSSAKVGAVSFVSHERFLYFLVSRSSSRWSEVGGALLGEEGWQLGGLSIKSNQTTPTRSWWSSLIEFEC